MRGALAVAALVAFAVSGALAEGPPGGLTEALEAHHRNVALGDALGGGPASEEQAAEAEQLYLQSLAQARAAIAADPRLAEAHRVAGMILCTAYRPVAVEAPGEGEGGSAEPKMVTTLRQGAAGDCEEGLAELRAAVRLSRASPDVVLDYAQALLACGDAAGAESQALAVWEQRLSLSGPQRARCARALAARARSQRLAQLEARWLREALAAAPDDAASARRLAELSPPPGAGIAWVGFEAGRTLARDQGKPIWMDFTAEWCGWCKKLESDVFSDSEVIALSREFVCVKVDADRRPDLVSAYRVEGYPTAVLLEAGGREVHRIVGYVPKQDYLARLRRGLPGG